MCSMMYNNPGCKEKYHVVNQVLSFSSSFNILLIRLLSVEFEVVLYIVWHPR
jgi:hypothetical protein